MWQYNFTYLCHADQRKDHKYIDRYKDRRGNWQYLYPEDIKKANSPDRSQRYSNVNEAQNAREAAIAKGTATAQRNKREYSAQNYRTAMTNSRTAGAKNASEAGESDRYAREKRQNAIPSYLRNYTKGSAERQGARAKDLDDVEKRNKTSEYLKAATERSKKETSRTVAAQNAREAAIAKSAETAQKNKTKTILNNVTARYEASTSRTDAAQNAREAAIQKSAKQIQAKNEYNKKASTAGVNAEWERRRAGRSSEEKLDLLDQRAAIKGNNGTKDNVSKQAEALGSYSGYLRELSDLIGDKDTKRGYDIGLEAGTKTNINNLAKKVAKQYVKQNKDASYDEVYDVMKRYITNVVKSSTTKDITEYISDEIFERLGLGSVKSNMDAKYKQVSEESRRKFEEQHKANVEKTKKEYEDLYNKELRNMKKRY